MLCYTHYVYIYIYIYIYIYMLIFSPLSDGLGLVGASNWHVLRCIAC